MRSSPSPTRSSPPPRPSRRPAPCRSSSTSIRRPAPSTSRRIEAGSPPNPGDRPGPPVRPAGRHGPDHGDRPPAQPGCHRGRLPGPRRALQGAKGRHHRGLGCFSFYPGKNLGAFGDAGAAVTADASMAQTMRMLREHGQSRKYYHDMEGYTARLDAIQAAVLRLKLRRLGAWNRPAARTPSCTTISCRDPRHHGREGGGIRRVRLPPLRHSGGRPRRAAEVF